MRKVIFHWLILIVSIFTISACSESSELTSKKPESASDALAKIKLEEIESIEKRRLKESCINKKYLGVKDPKCEDLN